MKSKIILFKVVEVILTPITILTAIYMKFLTKGGIHKTIFADKIFMNLGVLPIRDQYYQPLINPKKHLKKALQEDRNLPGINFNISCQLNILNSFNYNNELIKFPIDKLNSDKPQFYYNNNSFMSGDAEYLYNMIRYFKPQKMIEIGSGASTLISIEAFLKNKSIDPNYKYEHICIEPYEQPWLEETQAIIVREKVENINIEMFKSLNRNDILFIDSSHMIRPQGDVLFEFLEVLPVLNSGVLVHIHDIFSPKDYLESWIMKEHILWNEQYLLEAFLTQNNDFEIIGSLNFLKHNQKGKLESKCPILEKQNYREPGSFWIRRK